MTSVIHNIMSEEHKAKCANVHIDYAVSSNVGFCWAIRLAFTECPIDSQAEESLKLIMHQ